MEIQNLEDLDTTFGKQRKILLFLACILASIYLYLDDNKSKLRSSEGTLTGGCTYLLPQRKLVLYYLKTLVQNVDINIRSFLSATVLCTIRDLYILLRTDENIRKHKDLSLMCTVPSKK